MEPSDARVIAALLLEGIDSDEDVAAVVARTTSTWQGIDIALAPIIGKLGVAALYRRALHVTSSAHPWLATSRSGIEKLIDTADLASVMAERDLASAAAGATALFQNFCDLLTSLVGPSLAARLLGSVPAYTSSANPAPEATT